jgi:hypothetical protein
MIFYILIDVRLFISNGQTPSHFKKFTMPTCLGCFGAVIASVVGICAVISTAVQDRVKSVNANYFFDRRNRQAEDIQKAYARASAGGSSRSPLSHFSVQSGMSY